MRARVPHHVGPGVRHRSPALIFAPNEDTIARPNATLVTEWRETCMMGDLDGGVDRMRWRGPVWLPMEHMEEQGQYAARVARSDLYPGLTSALDEVGAQPFTKPVAIENAPAEMEALAENVDGDGNDITQFAKSLLRSACKYGRAHAFIDYAAMTAPGAVVTRADEMNAQPRPFWRLVEKPQLLNWRTITLPSGQTALSEIRLHEIKTVPDGKYGEKKAEYVRVIRRDSFEVWQNMEYRPDAGYATLDNAAQRNYSPQFYDLKENRQQKWAMIDSGPFGPEGGFDAVPLVTMYTGYMGFMRARSPFAKLAETNLTHWQSSSDQRNIIHVARVPILSAFGFNAEENKTLTIASGAAITSTNPEARLAFVEHSGSAVAAGQEDLESLERRMEQMGVRPHIERTANASATGVAVDASGAATDIQAWSQAADTALEQCFALSAAWMGIELPEDFDVQIYKDYGIVLAGPQDITALQADVAAGRVTDETYLREAKRRGLYSDDLDIEEEVAATEEVKQQKAEEASAKLAAMNPGSPGAKPNEPQQREAA